MCTPFGRVFVCVVSRLVAILAIPLQSRERERGRRDVHNKTPTTTSIISRRNHTKTHTIQRDIKIYILLKTNHQHHHHTIIPCIPPPDHLPDKYKLPPPLQIQNSSRNARSMHTYCVFCVCVIRFFFKYIKLKSQPHQQTRFY